MGEKNEIESPKHEADYGEGEVHDDSTLLRKIDWQILPTMFMTYFLQFVDKISLNVRAPSSQATATANTGTGSTRMSWACAMTWG